MSKFTSLPGFTPTFPVDQTNFKKTSHVKQEANSQVESQPKIYPLPRQQYVEEPNQKSALHPDYITTSQASYISHTGKDHNELYKPCWVKMDKHVLNFTGYFKESVVESPLEAFRIRKLNIFYYLEDNTVEINEPKQTNSGIPQGSFLKRQKVLKPATKDFIDVNDFVVGQDIQFFGKLVRITACNQYTREFYENLGIQQAENGDIDQDKWEQKTNTKYVPQTDHMMKDYLEHKLGGGRVPSQKQFLENDRKVLKFFTFSEVPYILHYYLADDTLEIREVKFQNSGRANFSLMLRRQKLPKKFALNQPGQTYAENFVKPEDISYGGELDVFGRKFQIQGCDQFTSEYYKNTYQIDFPIGQSELEQKVFNVPRQIPPYNGFGDEEDSLGYVYRLEPIPPKKDFFKWVDNQVNLRFVAQFRTNKPEDVNRRFVLTFFLNDDSVMVYEPTIRNSGIPDGKFLERAKYKNVKNNNQFFTPADFMVGSVIEINGWSFELMEVDEFTKKWYSSNVQFVKPNMQQASQQQYYEQEKAYQQFKENPMQKTVNFQQV